LPIKILLLSIQLDIRRRKRPERSSIFCIYLQRKQKTDEGGRIFMIFSNFDESTFVIRFEVFECFLFAENHPPGKRRPTIRFCMGKFSEYCEVHGNESELHEAMTVSPR
jgi:hypothetical protein